MMNIPDYLCRNNQANPNINNGNSRALPHGKKGFDGNVGVGEATGGIVVDEGSGEAAGRMGVGVGARALK